jgi:hypothetical protein
MYHLISEHERIQDTVRIWRERMAADAEGNMVLPDHSIWGHINHQPRITEGRSNRFLSHFRVQVAADPHAVEINIPSDGINENVLGAVAVDDAGRRWILRQGWLRSNAELGEVGLEEFPNHTTLISVEVVPAPQNHNRLYYAVACVDNPAEEVQAATAAFVHECDFVRRRRYDLITPAEHRIGPLAEVIRMAEGPPEDQTSYLRRAANAREILRRQARVWRALQALLGTRMHKPVIERLETDAMIDRDGELPLLIEIKSDNGAAAIEQGLGQLLLYGGLYRRHPKGSEVELVLLLPDLPRPQLTRVLEDHSIVVATYEDTDPPKFHSDFLARCRCQTATNP